jgi:hypothetical protein
MWASEIISCKINKEMFKRNHTLIFKHEKRGLMPPLFLNVIIKMQNRKRQLLAGMTKVELLPRNGKLLSS